MRVSVFVGTRPEALKLAPVILALRETDGVETTVISTGQHQSMLDSALAIFGIAPDRKLHTFQASQSLGSLGSNILREVDKVLSESEPDLAFVHGDTSTAFFSALASFYHAVPIAHIEAGLRTHNLHEPFPEEMNRRSIGSIAEHHLAPTPLARSNLMAEGVVDEAICVTGNTLVDSVRLVSEKYFSDGGWVEKQSTQVRESIFDLIGVRPFALVTLHRRENHGKTIEEYLLIVKQVAQRNPNFHFIFPVHPNPAVGDISRYVLSSTPNVHLTEPLDYLTFLWLLSQSSFVVSDSGGVQEEAITFGKALLLCRSVTERPEAIIQGKGYIIGQDFKLLADTAQRLIESATVQNFHDSQAELRSNPFGDGFAAQASVNFSLRRT